MNKKIIKINRDILIAQANRAIGIHDQIIRLDSQKHRKAVKESLEGMRNISYFLCEWFNEIIG